MTALMIIISDQDESISSPNQLKSVQVLVIDEFLCHATREGTADKEFAMPHVKARQTRNQTTGNVAADA